MKHTFTISGRLPGLNDVVRTARGNMFAAAGQKKNTQKLCAQYILLGRVPNFTAPVRVSFRWFEPDRRRDVDNIAVGAKFILDALVETGRLPNDTREWVRGLAHDFPDPDKLNPRIEVTLEEIEVSTVKK